MELGVSVNHSNVPFTRLVVFPFAIFKLLVPQRELCILLKVTLKYLFRLLLLKPCSSEKHCKHLQKMTGTVGSEYSGNQKKENKASSCKNTWGAVSTSSQHPMPATSLEHQGKVTLGNLPPFPSKKWKCTSFLFRTFVSASLENILHSFHSRVLSYRRQQGSFSTPGAPELWGSMVLGLRTTISGSLGERGVLLPLSFAFPPRGCRTGPEANTSTGFFWRPAINWWKMRK